MKTLNPWICGLLRLFFHLTGEYLRQRSTIDGLRHLPARGGYLLVMKEQSPLDCAFISLEIPRAVSCASKEACGSWQAEVVAGTAIRLAKRGKVVVLTLDGEQEPMVDILAIAREADIPVFPMALDYIPTCPNLFGRGQRRVVVVGPAVTGGDLAAALAGAEGTARQLITLV